MGPTLELHSIWEFNVGVASKFWYQQQVARTRPLAGVLRDKLLQKQRVSILLQKKATFLYRIIKSQWRVAGRVRLQSQNSTTVDLRCHADNHQHERRSPQPWYMMSQRQLLERF
jgi:hypothetical protein